MNIFIGSDHAGYELKEYLRNTLSELGHRVIDCGAYEYRESDDYPVFISKVARAVSEAEELKIIEDSAPSYEALPIRENHESNMSETRGIVIGGSGQGEAIAANKFKHVRAALCYGGAEAFDIVRLSREHNASNILSLGARFVEQDQALELVLTWINTKFSGDIRHVRRIEEIEQFTQDTLYNQ